MNLTFDVAAILGTVYLIGLFEFVLWCHEAPIAPESFKFDD